jgi:hypothetical protein
MRAVGSTSIAAVGYAEEERTLRVRFVGGGTYDYLEVPRRTFNELLDAPSKGRFVNWRIKPFYEVMRLE